MNIKKYLSLDYYRMNIKGFNEMYEYDKQFNASFRGDGEVLSKENEKIQEMKYIRLYRKCQANQNTIWGKLYYKKLVKMSEKTGIGLYVNLNIGKGLIIGHCGTIVMNDAVKFGDEIMLTHGVTIGRDVRGKRKGTPTIGTRVCIRANSTIVGNVTIGDDVLIAPNTFVNFDVPSHSIVIGNPASVHCRQNATEGHLGTVSKICKEK